MRRWIWFGLTLILIFASNTFFVHPRELPSDSAWLLQELSREETPPDVKRQGPLFVTPTRVAVGGFVYVTVEANSGSALRALVMIDREGQWLDTRQELLGPLRTQVFQIPLDGLTGDYRFWLSGEAQTPQSGLGVITVEVYDPVPGNLRRAAPLEVVQKLIEASQAGDQELAIACLAPNLASDASWHAVLQGPPIVRWVRGEVPYEEPQRPDDQILRCLVRVDLHVSYADDMPPSDFWGDRSVSRYFVLHHTLEGWRIASWSALWPEEFAASRPPTRPQTQNIPVAPPQNLPVTPYTPGDAPISEPPSSEAVPVVANVSLPSVPVASTEASEPVSPSVPESTVSRSAPLTITP